MHNNIKEKLIRILAQIGLRQELSHEAKRNQLKKLSQKKLNEHTIEIIESSIVDEDKLRDFDCIFCTLTKSEAIIFRDCLRFNHQYKTNKPHLDNNEWVLHVNKYITAADLREELTKVRKLAKIHSAELVDWMIEVDNPTNSKSSESETQTKN